MTVVAAELVATQSSSWWPVIIVALGGTAWALACIAVAARFEDHDGPVSFAIIPVILGTLVLVGVVESIW